MKNRVLWKMFVLSIVTLGIYRIYWFIKTRNEIMQLKPESRIWPAYVLFLPLAVGVLAFVGLIASIASSPTSERQCNSSFASSDQELSTDTELVAPSEDVSDDCSTSTVTIIGLVGFYLGLFVAWILYMVWIWTYARGVDIVSAGSLSFALAIIVLLVVPDGFDILVIQDHFNKLGTSNPPAPAAVTPQAV